MCRIGNLWRLSLTYLNINIQRKCNDAIAFVSSGSLLRRNTIDYLLGTVPVVRRCTVPGPIVTHQLPIEMNVTNTVSQFTNENNSVDGQLQRFHGFLIRRRIEILLFFLLLEPAFFSASFLSPSHKHSQPLYTFKTLRTSVIFIIQLRAFKLN